MLTETVLGNCSPSCPNKADRQLKRPPPKGHKQEERSTNMSKNLVKGESSERFKSSNSDTAKLVLSPVSLNDVSMICK